MKAASRRPKLRSDSIFRRRDPLEGVNLLDLKPVQLAEQEDVGDRIVLLRPVPRTRGLRGAVDRLLSLAAVPRVRLDEIGTAVWQELDGTNTVTDVAEALRARFGESVEPVEERVAKLIRMLHSEGFVAYLGYDEIPEIDSAS